MYVITICISYLKELKMDNLFDLNNISDIPAEIKQELNRDSFAEQIVELFNIANRELNVDEVTVGYYRKFNEIKTKRQIMTKLYNMSKESYPVIESVPGRKGVYRKKRNESQDLFQAPITSQV